MALVVITGGARSGKSRVAQGLAGHRGSNVVVAAFGRGADDEEMTERISRHRADRPGDWRTIEPEVADRWLAQVRPNELLVVDCLGTLVGRLMEETYSEMGLEGAFGEAATLPPGYEREVQRRLSPVLQRLLTRAGDTIVVTNEVGEGLVPPYATGRLFRDVLGRANRVLVDGAESAYLVVAGRCVELAGLPQDPLWPEAGEGAGG